MIKYINFHFMVYNQCFAFFVYKESEVSDMQTSELYDEVFLAQQRNKKAMANLLKKFRPLIKKYKCALNYDDAESELLISFIEMIYNINLKEFNGRL